MRYFGGQLFSELFCKSVTLAAAIVNFVRMIVIKCERCIDFCQRQIILSGDKIGMMSNPFVPDYNISNRDTATRDARLNPL